MRRGNIHGSRLAVILVVAGDAIVASVGAHASLFLVRHAVAGDVAFSHQVVDRRHQVPTEAAVVLVVTVHHLLRGEPGLHGAVGVDAEAVGEQASRCESPASSALSLILNRSETLWHLLPPAEARRNA